MSSTLARHTKLQQLYIGREATFESGSPAMALLRAFPVDKASLKIDPIEDQSARINWSRKPRIIGPKTGDLTVTLNPHGLFTSTPAESPTAHPLLDILGFAFGDLQLSDYIANPGISVAGIGGCTGSTLTALADLVGSALAYVQEARTHVSFLKTYTVVDATQVITWEPETETAPATGAEPLFGAMTFGAGMNDYTQAGVCEALRLIVESQEETLTCYGCWPKSLNLSCKEGELPVLKVVFGVSHWTEVVKNPASLPAGTYGSYPDAEPVCGGRAFLGNNLMRVSELEFDLGLDVKPVPGPAGTSGIVGWVVVDRHPTVKIKTWRDITREVADFLAQTGRVFTFWCGSGPGKILALQLPYAALAEYPKQGDKDGLQISEITMEGRLDPNYSETDGLAQTMARFALL